MPIIFSIVKAGRRSRVEGIGNECAWGRCAAWKDDGGRRSSTSTLGVASIGPSDDAASGWAFCDGLKFGFVMEVVDSGLMAFELTDPWTLTWFRGNDARLAASVAGNGGFCLDVSGASTAMS